MATKTFIPSRSYVQGQIQVQSKTMKRWQTKNFILDLEQQMFVIESSSSKKKQRVHYMPNYQIKDLGQKENKYKFDLEPKSQFHNAKKIHLAHNDENFAKKIMNTFHSCLKINPQISQKEQLISVISNQSIPLKLPKFFNCPAIIETLNHLNSVLLEYEELNQDLKFLKILKHKTKNLHFALKIEFPNVSVNVVYNLLLKLKNNLFWNPSLDVQSKVKTKLINQIQTIKYMELDQAYLNSEILKHYFFFREYVYMRHTYEKEGTYIIIDKSLDNKDIGYSEQKLQKGFIHFRIYVLKQITNQTILTVYQNVTSNSLVLKEEEEYLLKEYLILSQSQLYNYILNLNELNLNPKITKQIKFKQAPVEEEKISYKESRKNLDFEQYEELNQILYQAKVNQNVIIQSQSDQEKINFAKEKISQIENNSYLIIHLAYQHINYPIEKSEQNILKEIEEAHFFFRKDWVRSENGGLKLVSQEKISAQQQIMGFLLKRIGKKNIFFSSLGLTLLSGKSLINISLPVQIFEDRSTLERICNSMGYAPTYLERAAKLETNNYVGRIRECLCFAFGFLILFLSIEKPFNPIIGETFQGIIDNCPIYAEQVSHHPPVSYIQFYGRGYTVEAKIELQANMHSNSISGKIVGFLRVKFQNQTIYCQLAPGVITTFGDKIFLFQKKLNAIDLDNKIIGEIAFNPEKEYCDFFNQQWSPLQDQVVGGIFKVSEVALDKKYEKIDFKNENDIQQIYHRINGFWTTQLNVDNKYLFSLMEEFPHRLSYYKYPLPSDSSYRLDELWWILKHYENAQLFKEKLENKQREDHSLRMKYQSV